jgi:tRNA-specific adenosine deaminase 3
LQQVGIPKTGVSQMAELSLKRLEEECCGGGGGNTREMVAVRVNKKETFKYIREYSEKYPLPRHLKRVKKLDDSEHLLILVKPLSSFEVEEGYETVKVPWDEPLTRVQWEECNQIWPCDFFHSATEKQNHLHHQRIHSLLLSPTSIAEFTVPLVFYKDKLIIQYSSTYAEESERDCRRHCAFRLIEYVAQQGVTDYLLTDCVVLLPQEPCLACAMALLHSRVETLVFHKNTSIGALASSCKLMQLPGLNHYYKTYYVE